MLTVRQANTEPLYLQIFNQLQRLILGGGLHAGQQLPSVREVAGRQGINPMTVSRAYAKAEAEGLLERRPGVGMLVAEVPQHRKRVSDRVSLLTSDFRELADRAYELRLSPEIVAAELQRYLR